MLEAAVAVYVVAAFCCLLVPRQRKPFASVVITLLLVLMVHTEFAQPVSVGFTVAALFINTLGFLANDERRLANPWLISFITYFWIVMAATSGDAATLVSSSLQAITMVLFVSNIGGLGGRSEQAFKVVTVAVLWSQTALCTLERFAGFNALWPRRDGYSFRADGLNHLWDGAGGRALGTMGWSITLGEACAVLVVIALYFAVRERSIYWFVTGLAGVYVIVLSGTRTALIMLVVAAAAALVLNFARILLFVPLLMIVAILVLESLSSVIETFGFGQDTAGSVSVLHRSALWGAVPAFLRERPLLEVLFGSGYSSVLRYEQRGLFDGLGVDAWDNEYVRTLVGMGLVGSTIAIMALWAGLKSATMWSKLAIAALLVGAASYDILTWRALFFLLVGFLATRAPANGSRLHADHDQDVGATSNEEVPLLRRRSGPRQVAGGASLA